MIVSLLKGRSPLALWRGLCLSLFGIFAFNSAAQPLPINLQGRIAADGAAFNGTGKFKFALVNGATGALLWTHDGTGAQAFAFEPTTSIDLSVSRGLYAVMLGDTTFFGMTQPISPTIFTNTDVRLRIWFNDNNHGFQKLTPDQRLSAVGYALTSQKAQEASVLTGTVNISQVPAVLVTNNAVNINLTGTFTGEGSGLVGIRGSTPWQVVTNTALAAFPNTGYLVTNSLETDITLPTTASMRVGDIIRIAAPAGSWKAIANAGQQIKGANVFSGLGASWTARASSARWSSIASSADGSRLIAGTITSGHLQYSRDGGVTWTNSTSAVDPVKQWTAVASAADGQRLLAAATLNVLYQSKDGGDTWNAVGPSARSWRAIAVSGDGTNMLAAVFNSTLWVSNDGGDTWKEKTTLGTHGWLSVASSYDGSRMFAVGDASYYSTDKGTNWVTRSPALTLVACSADGMKVAGVSANQIVTSADGGTNWTTRAAAGTRSWNAIITSADGARIVAASSTGVYVSVNGGTTWNSANLAAATGLAMNSDGTKVAASLDGLYIQIGQSLRTQTSSVAGFLIGDDYSSVELQHVGGGAFMVLTSAGNLFAY